MVYRHTTMHAYQLTILSKHDVKLHILTHTNRALNYRNYIITSGYTTISYFSHFIIAVLCIMYTAPIRPVCVMCKKNSAVIRWGCAYKVSPNSRPVRPLKWSTWGESIIVIMRMRIQVKVAHIVLRKNEVGWNFCDTFNKDLKWHLPFSNQFNVCK